MRHRVAPECITINYDVHIQFGHNTVRKLSDLTGLHLDETLQLLHVQPLGFNQLCHDESAKRPEHIQSSNNTTEKKRIKVKEKKRCCLLSFFLNTITQSQQIGLIFFFFFY